MTAPERPSVGEAILMQQMLEAARLDFVTIHDPLFQQYSVTVQDLIKRLGPRLQQDGVWTQPVRYLRAVRTALTLWPGDAQAATTMDALSPPEGWPAHTLEALRPYGEEEADLILRAWGYIEEMGASERPLGATLLRIVRGLRHVSRTRIVCQARWIAPTESWLEARVDRFPAIVSSSMVSGEADLEHLVVLGPMGWYPEGLRAVPRARMTMNLAHAWIRIDPPRIAVLDDLSGANHPVGPIEAMHSVGTAPQATTDAIDADDLREGLSQAELDDLTTRVRIADERPTSDGARSVDIEVEARLFVLANDQVVFLPAAAEARRDAAVLKDGDIEIDRMLVRALRPGAFLIVRRGGSRDYVEELADAGLIREGLDPGSLRDRQSVWKDRLQDLVRRDGLISVREALRAAGLGSATTGNLNRWLSADSIGLGRRAEFLLLLGHLGFDGPASQEIVALTERLRSAHQAAGLRARALLIERAAELSPGDLERDGHVEVELPGMVVGALLLARIEQVSASTTSVPSRRLGLAMDVT